MIKLSIKTIIKKKEMHIVLLLCLFFTPARGMSQTFESQQATICLSIGTQASIKELDDFILTPVGLDGNRYSVYKGKEKFKVVSNGGVRIVASGESLMQGEDKIEVGYSIDGLSNQISTPKNQVHDQEHELTGIATLAEISHQRAGHYEGQVTLTVYALGTAGGGCGAQVINFPQESQSTWSTLAFEDLYPRPGDADYNDMVVQFRAKEEYNASGGLSRITMDFLPVARGAGYNHKLKLNLDGSIENSANINFQTEPLFKGEAEVIVKRYHLQNNNYVTTHYSSNEEIILFENTRRTIGGFANVYANTEMISPKESVSLEIILENPEWNLFEDRIDMDAFRYRPYLHVLNTRYDIDLAQNNPLDGMIDNNGYPFGIVVPIDWRWPLEGVSIDSAYPYFSEYRQWLIGEVPTLSPNAQQWYYHPADDAENKVYLP